MCQAVPAKIVEVREDDRALIEVGGLKQEISTALIDDPTVGDYVIVHVGFALTKLDPEEAKRTLELFAQLEQSGPPSQ